MFYMEIVYKDKLQHLAAGILWLLLTTACNTDNFTGDSVVMPSQPTVIITVPTIPASFDYGTGGSYDISVALSEVQVVDVKVASVVEPGSEAIEDVDFSITNHTVVVSAQKTTANNLITLTVADDAVRETDKSLIVTIGDYRTANASIEPVVINIILKKAPDHILNPPPAPAVDFTLRWEFANPLVNIDNACVVINDFDLTIQNPGDVNMYDTDILGYIG